MRRISHSGAALDGHEGLQVLTEFLDQDTRPSFILDAHNHAQQSSVIYRNRALKDFIIRLSGVDHLADFETWAVKFEASKETANRTGAASNLSFRGFRWTSSVVKQKWRVVYAIQGDEDRDNGREFGAEKSQGRPATTRENSDYAFPSPTISVDELRMKAGLSDWTQSTADEMVLTPFLVDRCLDWTRNPPQNLSGYRRFILDHDWASTPLGPIETWDNQLRQSVVMIMASPDPRLILWGNDLCLVYNEACLALIGQKHPSALGHGPMHVFAEIWQPLKSIVKRAMQQGIATRVQDLELMIDRDGRFGPEETYCELF